MYTYTISDVAWTPPPGVSSYTKIEYIYTSTFILTKKTDANISIYQKQRAFHDIKRAYIIEEWYIPRTQMTPYVGGFGP